MVLLALAAALGALGGAAGFAPPGLVARTWPALASSLPRVAGLPPTPLAIAALQDDIEALAASATATAPALASGWLLRRKRYDLLASLLAADRPAYLETASLLGPRIGREELPNLEGVALAAEAAAAAPPPPPAAADPLVADCTLPNTTFAENPAEAVLLSVTRNLYAVQTGVPRTAEGGIRGLLGEMRQFYVGGADAEAQVDAVYKTLLGLMTPVLPPFYRLFMGAAVPSSDAGDPEWLVDAAQKAAEAVPFADPKKLAPGARPFGGPAFYAPYLTSVVAPFVFGFLVGPGKVNRRRDGALGGLVVTKCKFLQESGCKGMCLNSCKLPAQQLFDDLGVPLAVKPNFDSQECQWSWGEVAADTSADPEWPPGCLVGCESRAQMSELRQGG